MEPITMPAMAPGVSPELPVLELPPSGATVTVAVEACLPMTRETPAGRVWVDAGSDASPNLPHLPTWQTSLWHIKSETRGNGAMST